MTRPLLILGAGNGETHRLVRDLNEAGADWELVGYLDDAPDRGPSLFGVPILGPLDLVADPRFASAQVVSSIGKPSTRRRIAQRLGLAAGRYATLVHPSVDRRDVEFGRGVLVYAGCRLNPGSTIGDQCFLSYDILVSHDCTLGDFCSVYPRATLLGRVRVGEEVALGSASTVLPDVQVGDRATVGAGAVVLRSVPAGATVVGNPARVVRADPSPRSAP